MQDFKAARLEEKLGVSFRNKNLLKAACTHHSAQPKRNDTYDNNSHLDNMRLEFLGGRVIKLLVAKRLLTTNSPRAWFPLEKLQLILRASTLYRPLADVAEKLALGDFLVCDNTTRNTLRANAIHRAHVLSGMLKAIVAAMYLDRGEGTAELFLDDVFLRDIEILVQKGERVDVRKYLQGLVEEKFGSAPTFTLLNRREAQITNRCTVGVFLKERLLGRGMGANEDIAQIEAAKDALLREFPEESASTVPVVVR